MQRGKTGAAPETKSWYTNMVRRREILGNDGAGGRERAERRRCCFAEMLLRETNACRIEGGGRLYLASRRAASTPLSTAAAAARCRPSLRWSFISEPKFEVTLDVLSVALHCFRGAPFIPDRAVGHPKALPPRRYHLYSFVVFTFIFGFYFLNSFTFSGLKVKSCSSIVAKE